MAQKLSLAATIKESRKMKTFFTFTTIKKTAIEFVTVFAAALVTVALITLLWNLIGHGQSAVDWETSFRFATIFGVILTWVKSRETRNQKQQKENK